MCVYNPSKHAVPSERRGEALTACRILPPKWRIPARSAVFAARRAVWLFVLSRDLYSYSLIRHRWGAPPAAIAPVLSLLLLYLDW